MNLASFGGSHRVRRGTGGTRRCVGRHRGDDRALHGIRRHGGRRPQRLLRAHARGHVGRRRVDEDSSHDWGGTHGTVSGKVRAADGTGVPGCSVVPKLVEGDVGVPEKSVVSKEDGSYSWPLPPGTYDFTVVCDIERDPAVPDRYDGLEGSSSNLEVTSGETTALDIDLS
ncbi:carboxypeptidase-like regulatory domain-containing protein [Streptomyces sp. NPDC054940]